ncbi:SHOCT domain-containing protein [Natrononativus amylolyticus]|uniref:SHOCT domain-containing protein n=1 Tax=Natrononativus amylolyticus TaxID=2963434 RepID=UPI0020CC879B|nr:SHOCT domain-containing protein [Natrononativus amylolyticus]
MGDRLQRFVAEDLWLLIAVVTFAILSLVGLAGLEALAGAIAIVGWFLLTPIFLFWGEEIADWLFEEREPERTHNESEGALDELKRRYAEGEIDDAEFEHRLNRLLEVDDALEGVFASDPGSDDGIAARDRQRDSPTEKPERDDTTAEDTRERELN